MNNTIKVKKKHLIVAEGDAAGKAEGYVMTPSCVDDNTEINQQMESNKDIGHAMSFEDIANTLATNSADNRTLNKDKIEE